MECNGENCSLDDREPLEAQYVFRLYVAGITPRSIRAIRNTREMCEEHLRGRYRLEVFDVYQQPCLAHDQKIMAAPTLIKMLPLPSRKIVGDLSDLKKIRVQFDLPVRA